MHPVLFHIGSLLIPMHGVFSLAALLIGIWFIRRTARIEGRDPSRTTDALVLSIAVGYVGARLMEVVINWEEYTASPDRARLVLVSSGVFVGALITGVPFAIFWFRHIKLPVLLGLDLVGLVAAIAEGIGRWGCFFSGCCYGTPTNLPWGVRFPEIARQLHPGLPAVPVHPTQIYSALVGLAILGVLVALYRRKRFHGRIFTSYLVLYSIARFLLEFVRGDPQRGFVLGGLLSTSQFVCIFLGLGGAAWYVYLDRRHRQSGEPDWAPAPPAAAAAAASPPGRARDRRGRGAEGRR
jgi:phosphatidylglycerol:prolipoprotein diacylglycerol transferase